MDVSTLSKDQKEAYIIGMFSSGKTAKDIVKLTGLSAPTILEYRKTYDEKQEAKDIADIIRFEESEQIKEVAAIEDNIIELDASDQVKTLLIEDLTESVSEVNGLQILNVGLQTAAIAIVTSVSEMTKSNLMSAKDIEKLAGALCSIQESFFNPNQTNINIQNNNSLSENSFSDYLRD